MEEAKKSRQQKRDERKKWALEVVLDQDREPQHFWEALLISNIDNLIDRIGWLESSVDNIVDAVGGASKSADRLSRRILWLNVILVVLGALGLFVAGYEVLFK